MRCPTITSAKEAQMQIKILEDEFGHAKSRQEFEGQVNKWLATQAPGLVQTVTPLAIGDKLVIVAVSPDE